MTVYNQNITVKKNREKILADIATAYSNEIAAKANQITPILTIDGLQKVQDSTTTTTQLAIARNSLDQVLNELTQNESSEQLQSVITDENCLPMISGEKGMYNPVGASMSRTMTSEWGQQGSISFNNNLIASIMDLKTPASNYLTAFPDDQTQFSKSPIFTANAKKVNTPTELGIDLGVHYHYSLSDNGPIPFAIFAIKNTNLASSKTFTLKFKSSGYSSYSGASVVSYVPDVTNNNRAAITSFTFSTLYALYSGDANVERQATVVIPANKTAIIVMTGGTKYHTTNTAWIEMYVKNINEIMADPELKADINTMEVLRRSMEAKPINSITAKATTLLDLIRLEPTVSNLQKASISKNVRGLLTPDLISVTQAFASNLEATTAGLIPGDYFFHTGTGATTQVVPSYENNGLAVTGGMIVGAWYWNTTSSTYARVV